MKVYTPQHVFLDKAFEKKSYAIPLKKQYTLPETGISWLLTAQLMIT